MRPLSEPGVLGRITPFLGITSIAMLLVLFAPTASFDAHALIAAAVVTASLATMALTLPCGRWPAWTEAILPLACFVVVALLRQAEGGASLRSAPLVLLPAFWLAIYGSRPQLLCSIAGTAAILVVPRILSGSPLDLVADWGGAGLWAATALLAGSALQELVGQTRQRAADIAALGAITRATLAGADSRPELCSAAQVVTGAAFAVAARAGRRRRPRRDRVDRRDRPRVHPHRSDGRRLGQHEGLAHG